MTDSSDPTPVAALKEQARRLREGLRASGQSVTQSQALELLARQHGARDWNTLRARAGNRLILRVGERVSGRYLGQPFTAELRGITTLNDGAQRRVTLHFDEPVDVVRFDSFSSFRQRVSGVIGWDGRSPRSTSDGQPQLVIHEVI